jgi:hypothetical protein
MAVQIRSNLARDLIGDPVKAASVLMNADLDIFQAAKFRYWWFTPTVMDHSGVSVGKSELLLLLGFLRLMLLPLSFTGKPRIVTVYYPSQGTAEEVFLPKLEEYAAGSNLFYSQIRMQHGRKLWKVKKNVIIIQMREGGWLELPAGDFMKDSQNQASKRFNDLLADEVSKMDVLGHGVSKELLQRNTRECFNPNHPIHANKTLFLAHAESPEHPYYKRFRGLERAIKKGSQDVVVLTSSYKDYRGEHKRKYGQDAEKKAKEQYLTSLDEAEHAQVWDGLWRRGSKGLYPDSMRRAISRSDLRVHLRRQDEETVYYLGWDTSSGAGDANDWNAGFVTAATPVSVIPDMRPGYMTIQDQIWFMRAVYAVLVPPGADVDQKSGLIHALHMLFGFSGIMLDNRGGGTEVSQKLRESRQLINNEWRDVTGLCKASEAFVWPMADPIVNIFDRGDPLLRPFLGERFIKDNSGPVDWAHRHVSAMMRRGEFAWTPLTNEMTASDLSAMNPDEQRVLLDLEKCLSQFGNIGVKVAKDGSPIMSENNFRRFVNKGKKDGALGAIYSSIGMRCMLSRNQSMAVKKSTNRVMGVF